MTNSDDQDSTHLDDDDSVSDGHNLSANNDQTVGDDGTVGDDQTVGDTDAAADLPQPSAADQPPESDADQLDDSATVVEDTVSDEAAQVEDHTVLEAGSPSQSSDVTMADKTVNTDEKTLADSSIQAASDTDGTVVESEEAAEEADPQFDQTIADSSSSDSSGIPKPDDSAAESDQTQVLPNEDDDFDRTLNMDGELEASADQDDRTLVEPSSGDRPAQDVDSDATQVESMNAGDHDRTQIESDDVDATQLQTDGPVGTFGEFSDGATEVTDGDADYSNDQTQVSGAETGGDKFRGKKRKPAHATADRWEQQQRYELVTNFARGGLGQIWMAQDVRLKREVAFKELLPSALRNSSALERFLEEAQITGQLEHPGIVPIYDIGYQANGTPFYSMKLVRGETMEKYIEEMHALQAGSSERILQFRKLLRSFIDICNAMAFAHDRGVLHRDLKPLNVMVGAFGETLVLDWGLAKIIGTDNLADDHTPLGPSADGLGADGETVIESSTPQASQASGDDATHVVAETSGSTASQATASLIDGQSQGATFGSTRRMVVTDVRTAGSQTMTGSVMGTPAYMPPEQARGDIDDLDARCDIYALGGILYKLLTNHQPIGRGKLKQVLQDVKDGKIVPPRKHDPSIERPLEAVCMKALATKEDDRYDSALKLAADVEAWLADEPVSVFEEPFMVRFRRWRKRHRTAVTSSSVAALLLVVVWVGLAWSHSMTLESIRADVKEHVDDSDAALALNEFTKAKDEITEAIGRANSEADLADLANSMNAKLEVIESRRVGDLRQSVEAQLSDAVALIGKNQYANARTKLVELSTLLKDDNETLPELTAKVVNRVQQVEARLNVESEIIEAASKFTKFEEHVDQARLYGNLDPFNPLADDDAKKALTHARNALAVFEFEKQQAVPQHFSDQLSWTRLYFGRTGNWPSDVLRVATFDMLVVTVNVQQHVARNEADAEKRKTQILAAIASLDTAIQLKVGTFAASAMQADLYDSIEMNEQSKQILERLKTQKPSTFQDFFLLGNNERQRFLSESALKNFETALRHKPGDFWTQQYLAWCHLQLGQYRAAIAYLTNCVSQRPDFAWVRMQRGMCYLAMGDFKAALVEFNDAEKTDPNLYHVFVNRGATYVQTEEFDKAKADFAKAAALDPKSAVPLINLATVHLETASRIQSAAAPFDQLDPKEQSEMYDQEIKDALKQLAIAEELAPTNSLLFERKATALDRQGRLLEAKASYQKSADLEREPSRKCETLKRLALIEFQAQEYDVSRKLFEAANAANSNDAESLFYIAECYLNQKDSQKAITYYNSFLDKLKLDIKTKLSPPELLFNGMALAYSQMANHPKAMQYYSLSLMFNEDYAHSLTRRGWAYVMRSHTFAEQDFRNAVKADPKNADAQIGLAYALVKQRRLEETLVEIDKGVQLASSVILAETKRQPVDVRKLGELFILYHNASTVYAQAIVLEQNPAKRKSLVDKALQALSNAHKVAKIGNKQATMLAYMIQDSALNPLKLVAKDDFAALFNQLKQDGR
jgi:serine/threonine protein kinase/Flp pilus assembly protein TadD